MGYIPYFVQFSYGNPATFWKAGTINEGLIRTYNPKTTWNYIYDVFEGVISLVSCKDYKFVINIRTDLVYELDQCMMCCGYYKNHPDVNKDDFTTVCYYAAKYTNNKSLEGIDGLFHFAPKYVKNKILQQGFVPKSKNELFDYPGRVHFLYNIPDIQTFYNIGKVLCEHNTNPMNNKEYVLFCIDTDMIHDDVKFQFDQDYLGRSLFTYDNIPPETIIGMQPYDFNKTFEENFYVNQK